MQIVKSKEGHIITEMNDVKQRWKENYEELYNHKNPVNEHFVSQIHQMPSMEPEPRRPPDLIYINVKAAGEEGIDILHKLCLKISGGFKSQQCQLLLTRPPYLRAPQNKYGRQLKGKVTSAHQRPFHA